MALSLFQRDVCRLLASNRLLNGESYLAAIRPAESPRGETKSP